MNERIKQLELEAIAYADSKVPAMDRYNDIYHSIVRGKFAELIVRECCDIFVELRTRPADLAVKDVKKHFGVDK